MQKVKLKISLFLGFGVILLCAANVCAETIRLKNGKSVDGKIIEKTDKYVKIDVAGVGVTYFNDEIEKIEESSLGQGPYVNQEYGFEINMPVGWFQHVSEGGTRGEVYFTKSSSQQIIFPLLGITTDTATEDIKSAMDFAKRVLPKYEEAAKANKATMVMIEPAHEIEINGLKGARFVYEHRGEGRAMTSIDCKFMQGNLVISLQGMDHPQAFQQHLNDFEQAINSFRFTKSAGPMIYQSEEFDFQISGPKGWRMLKEQALEHPYAKVSFTKYSGEGWDKNCWITVYVCELDLDDQGKSGLDIVKKEIADLEQGTREGKVKGYVLVDPVKEVELGGLKGTHWAYLLERDAGGAKVKAKTAQYHFLNHGYLYTVAAEASEENLNLEEPVFKEVVAGFKFLSGKQDYFLRRQDNLEELKPLASAEVNVSAPVSSDEYAQLKDEIINKAASIKGFCGLYLSKDKNQKEFAQDAYTKLSLKIWYISPQEFEVYQGIATKNNKTGEIMKLGDIWRVFGDKLYSKIGIWMDASGFGFQSEAECKDEKEKEAYRGLQKMQQTRKEAYKIFSLNNWLDILKKESPSGIDESHTDYTALQFKNVAVPSFSGNNAETASRLIVWVANSDKTIRFVQAQLPSKDAGTEPVLAEWYYGSFNFPFIIGKPRGLIYDSTKGSPLGPARADNASVAVTKDLRFTLPALWTSKATDKKNMYNLKTHSDPSKLLIGYIKSFLIPESAAKWAEDEAKAIQAKGFQIITKPREIKAGSLSWVFLGWKGQMPYQGQSVLFQGGQYYLKDQDTMIEIFLAAPVNVFGNADQTAIEKFLASVRLVPKQEKVGGEDLLREATGLYQRREFDKAISLYEKALPEIIDKELECDILFMLSSCYLEKGIMAYITNKDNSFYKKAIGYAEQCLALNPRYWYALANIATVYMNTNELEKADSYYAKAEQYVSSNDPGYQQLIAKHATVRAVLKLRKEQGK